MQNCAGYDLYIASADSKHIIIPPTLELEFNDLCSFNQ